jgi:hypothetical protein
MSPERAPFLLFFGAVVCAGWIGGLSVGLLATAVWKAGTKSALISHNRGWIAHSVRDPAPGAKSSSLSSSDFGSKAVFYW